MEHIGAIKSVPVSCRHKWDEKTGLSYYRARYYDPNTGRFLSEDPIRFNAGANFYAYAANSPVDLLDPSGLLPRSRDRWYGQNDRDFQRWFHRCWKQEGDPDASKEEIDLAYAEWVNRGRPGPDNCWGNKKKRECEDTNKAKTKNQQWWNDFWSTFWDGVHEDQWLIEERIKYILSHPCTTCGFGPGPAPVPLPVVP